MASAYCWNCSASTDVPEWICAVAIHCQRCGTEYTYVKWPGAYDPTSGVYHWMTGDGTPTPSALGWIWGRLRPMVWEIYHRGYDTGREHCGGNDIY